MPLSSLHKAVLKGIFDFKAHDDNNNIDIKIHVTDTGKGIPKDQQDLIFNDFEQVQSNVVRSLVERD